MWKRNWVNDYRVRELADISDLVNIIAPSGIIKHEVNKKERTIVISFELDGDEYVTNTLTSLKEYDAYMDTLVIRASE